MTRPDQAAFPLNELDQGDSGNLLSVCTEWGLSKREHFAAHAMLGLLAGRPQGNNCTAKSVAEAAVKQADALIAALNAKTDS